MSLMENMFEHKYADVNNIRLHYVTAGNGKLIMFLHGFPEFWYEWKNQLAEFGRDYQAVAPDMRGYNLSSKPTKNIWLKTYVLLPRTLGIRRSSSWLMTGVVGWLGRSQYAILIIWRSL
jgi:pimeloyl-ACP methyl ester carboxylesterase